MSGPCAEVPGFEAGVTSAVPAEVRRPPAQAEMQVRVRTQLGEHPRADVEVFDAILQAPAGERVIQSEQAGCAELQSQLALVLGILVEAGRGAPAPAQPEAPAPAEPEPPPPEREGVHRVRPSRTLRIGPKRTHILGLVGGAGWGLLPGAFPGVELRWSVSTQKGVPVRVAGAFDGPGTVALQPGRVKLFAGRMTVGACPEWPWGPVRVGLCGWLGLGATRAEGFALGTNLEERALALLVGAEGFVSTTLAGPLEVVVGMQALGVPYRPRFAYFELDGTRVVAFQPAPVSFRGHAGLQLRFR